MKTEIVIAMITIFIDVLWLCSFALTLANQLNIDPDHKLNYIDFRRRKIQNRLLDWFMILIHAYIILHMIILVLEKIVSYTLFHTIWK